MLSCIVTGQWHAHTFDTCRCCTPAQHLQPAPDFHWQPVQQGSVFGGGY